MEKPAFLITINTEGDNLWSCPTEIRTRNSLFLPRFQELCERYRLKPTYLTNYEMAMCPAYRAFALAALQRGTAEVGMHLHAWHSPPHAPLTGNDYLHQPYLIEFPTNIMREKVVFMTRLLEENFEIQPQSHRAGRWAFNAIYARLLTENGYRTDCSVTPRVSWKTYLGDPSQSGGSDYSAFPDRPYLVDLDNIGSPGKSALLELPMTILSLEPDLVRTTRQLLGPKTLPSRALGRFYPAVVWLRPTGVNLGEMLRVLRRAKRERYPYVEFMLHSSEFMPGGSPTFATEASIEKLYEDLEALFEAARGLEGASLSEFAARFLRKPEAAQRG